MNLRAALEALEAEARAYDAECRLRGANPPSSVSVHRDDFGSGNKHVERIPLTPLAGYLGAHINTALVDFQRTHPTIAGQSAMIAIGIETALRMLVEALEKEKP